MCSLAHAYAAFDQVHAIFYTVSTVQFYITASCK
jgi:hypothetical protein